MSSPANSTTLEGWELQNMLTLARVMIEAALLREESRGVHLRTDFPQLDDAHWNKHLWFQRNEADAWNGGERPNSLVLAVPARAAARRGGR